MMTMALWMLTTLATVAVQTAVCSVSLMTPTAAVALRLVVLHREAGTFPVELLLVVFLVMLLITETSFHETEDKMLYVFCDTKIHLKEDVSAVYCWEALSMSTSVSNTSGQNPQSL